MELREPSAKYLVRPGYRQTEVGVIPEDWEFLRLTSVATLESGHTPSRRRAEYWGGEVRWVSLHDTDRLDGKELYETTYTVTDEGISNSSARVLPKGTVVFSRTATVGKVGLLGRDMATSQDFANFICGARVVNHYLVCLFQWMEPEWHRLMAGSTHSTIYMPAFQSLHVVLPPVEEQQAIADALGDADALIESLEHLLAKQRLLRQATMQALLTGERRLPGFEGAWREVALGETGEFLKGSGVARGDTQSGDLPCIRYGEIYTTHDDVIRDFQSWISPQVAACATRLKQGDILFAGSGETKEDIGKCVAFVDDCEAYAGGDIVILRSHGCDPVFLGYALNTPVVNRQKASFGQGDAVVHISASALAQVLVGLPPLPEQTGIATVLSDLDAEIAALEARIAKARLVKQGMMRELLTGRIRLV